MDNQKENTSAVGINMPSNCSYAADLFCQLSADNQKAIIDLIKSLLSEK